jgi:hypothetical protein
VLGLGGGKRGLLLLLEVLPLENRWEGAEAGLGRHEAIPGEGREARKREIAEGHGVLWARRSAHPFGSSFSVTATRRRFVLPHPPPRLLVCRRTGAVPCSVAPPYTLGCLPTPASAMVAVRNRHHPTQHSSSFLSPSARPALDRLLRLLHLNARLLYLSDRSLRSLRMNPRNTDAR